MTRFICVLCFCFLAGFAGAQDSTKPPSVPPDLRKAPTNVVFILTDNHGAWTLGCYGNPDIQTPNIDRLAAEGIRFSRAFCNNAVCSPTRATYLTGLMPSQHGVHNFLSGGRLQIGPDARNTLAEFTSLPEVLSSEGYACGLVGKWHLGANMEPQEELDDYWITMPHGGTPTFFDAPIIENGEQRREPEHLTTFWTKHAVKFIEQNRENPFFLYLAYNGPYGLSRWQLEPLRGPRVTDYENKWLPSFPRGVIHPWEYNNREYFGDITAIRRYAAELSAIDDGVGRVMETLKRLGLEKDTLVVFAADQGWAGGQHGLWGMGDHTRPLNAFEHSMRIPLIFRQPGAIPAGRVSDAMTSNYDFMPSVLSYLGLEKKMPVEPKSPGRDYAPILRGEKVEDWKDEVFYEYENLRCVRTGDWKYVERFENGYDELYNLAEDPGERHNLAGNEEAQDVLGQLKNRLDDFFARYTEPKYDLWRGGISQTRTILWGEEAKERQRARIARGGIAPTDFDLSWNPPEMSLPEGYVAEVVAAPPLVEHPMMASFDDRGRLFVAEAAGVNLKQEELEKERPNRIRLLEDTTGDGIFDRSTVFADEMTFPQGALWMNGALYVASPPSIWMLVDTDEDGVCDQRFEIATGFEYTGNAADVHGPFLHPNGRLYWCHGRKGHEVYQTGTNELVSKAKGARIWSCRPDGTDIQVHAGGGMDNPVEIDFTPEGEIIGSVNLFYGRPRGDTLVHWLYGGRYPRYDQQAVLDEFKKTGEPLREIHDFGHVAVSGMTLAKEPGLNPEWHGDVFAALFNTQRIVRTDLERSVGSFKAGRTETILEAHNPDVHFTDVVEDADGTLLAIDTGGWFRIGCPTSQIAKPDIPGAIYRIRKSGIYDRKTDSRGGEIDWGNSSADDLAILLGDERRPVQEKAIRELALREEGVAEVLRQVIETGSVTARRNAVWAACRNDSESCREVVRFAVEDKETSVSHAACNALAATGDPEAVDVLQNRLLAGAEAVQVAAATALGRIGKPAAAGALLDMLGRDLSRPVEHACIYALIEIDAYQPVAAALLSEDDQVKRRVLWALDQMESSQLDAARIIDLAESWDGALLETAFEIMRNRTEWAPVIAQRIEDWLNEGKLGDRRAMFLKVLPSHLENPEVQGVIGRLMSVGEDHIIKESLRLITASEAKVNLAEGWVPGIRKALESNDDELVGLAARALTKIETEWGNDLLQKIAADSGRPRAVRFWALRAGADPNKPLSENTFDLLLTMLSPDAGPAERAEAVSVLGTVRLSTDQLVRLAEVAQNAGPVDLPGILEAFTRNRTPEVGVALSEAIAKNPAVSSVAIAELKRLLVRFPDGTTEAALERLNEIESSNARKMEVLESLLARVESGEGNPQRGKAAFLAGKGACMTCHKVGEEGRHVGPDLSTIGRIRTSRDLLESVIFPGVSIARDFEAYTIEMKDGSVHMGIVRSEKEDVLNIVAAGGLEMQLRQDEVVSMNPAPVSLMPTGLEQGLSEEELIDLVAWLRTLK